MQSNIIISHLHEQLRSIDAHLSYMNNKLEELDAEKQFTIASAMKHSEGSISRNCYQEHYRDLMKIIIPLEWDAKVAYDKKLKLQEQIDKDAL